MKHLMRVLPACLLLGAVGASAQFYKLKGAAVAVNGTGVWTTPLTSSPTAATGVVGVTNTGSFLNETATNQQQGATTSAGVLATLGFHPVPFAGIELNYQFAQFSEQYSFNYSSQPTQRQLLNVPVAFHEATAAYQFHPKHIKFQPYVNIGGGAVDFLPQMANNQWRGAGLIETGFDIPTKSPHIAIRVQGRALIYRAPNFNNSLISSRGWVVTEQPTGGLVYRF